MGADQVLGTFCPPPFYRILGGWQSPGYQ